MISDDEVGPTGRDAGQAIRELEAVGGRFLGPLGIRLDQHRPIARVGAIAQQVASDRSSENGNQHPVSGRRGRGPVGDVAARVVYMAVLAVPGVAMVVMLM